MTKLQTINLAGNNIQDINPLLIMLASGTTANGTLDLNYNGSYLNLTTQGSNAVNTLRARGWVIYF